MKVLVIQTASIGDVILVTPVIEALYATQPGVSIHLLVKEGMQQLFSGHNLIDELLVWQKSRNKYRNLWRLMQRVRRARYDQVVVIQRFMSAGILAVYSGAKVISGFSENPLSRFFTHRTSWYRSGRDHETVRNLSLVKHLEINGSWKPRLYPSDADRARVQTFITKPFITIAPASLWNTKQFPEEGWVAFLDRVPAEIRCYIIGGQQDIDLSNRIRNKTTHPDVLVLAGELSLVQTAVLMESAKMSYTNDSAPLHLASAMNAPVTAIYCSTVPDFGFGPLSDIAHIVETTEALQCRPCGIHGFKTCPEKHFRCGLSINTQQLLKTLP